MQKQPDPLVTPNYIKCEDFVQLMYETYHFGPSRGMPSMLKHESAEHECQIWAYNKFFIAHSHLNDNNYVGFGDPLDDVVELTDVTKMASSEILAYIVVTVLGEITEN